jgi:hypothetical protein
MDPLHITEFASDRYFTKFNQQQQQHQNGQSSASSVGFSSNTSAAASTTFTVPAPVPQSSPFILPLRDTKAVHDLEGKDKDVAASRMRHKKSRFHLKGLIHSKQQQHAPVPAYIPISTPFSADLAAALPHVTPVPKA